MSPADEGPSWRKARRVMCRSDDGRLVEVVTGLLDIEPGLMVPMLRVGDRVVVLDEAASAEIITNIRHTLTDWLEDRRRNRP